MFFFFKQKTAYEMRISDWSSDVCSSDLMRKYFATLERLIALNPRVIIPSHGMALGTVYRLEETLKHRRQREQQVLSLWREGKDLETMLGVIYAGLDPRLLTLARMNIDSHLDKLRAEGVLEAAT